MRPQKVLDIDILEGLTQEFRSKGFEGASLKDLAEATGLKKASLYHRFPNGKREMAEAVFTYMGKWVEDHIFSALGDEENPPALRLKNGLAQIDMLYAGGEKTCILRALSMQSGLELFQEQIRRGMVLWLEAFQKIGLALGLTSKIAQENALQSLIAIQGSLVVAKGLNDSKVFSNVLRSIENRYLA